MLVLDPGKKTRCDNALSLLFALRSFSRLWQKPQLTEADLTIRDQSYSLRVSDQGSQSSEPATKSQSRAFAIVLAGGYEHIEPLRLPIVEFIEEQKFEHRYITKDEVSGYIACELYPYLYRVENSLRGYLTRFMTTRFGGTWWKLTASKEMDEKAKMRKKNELVFGKRIDNSSFLIDFDELGELIFEQTSGFLTREDIENRVMQLAEDVDALKALKSDLQSNYHKFFKKAFADRDFKQKWKAWESLRNKVAHTNLFTNDDLVEGKKIAAELMNIISDADESPEQPTVTQVEREAVQEQIIARTGSEPSVAAVALDNSLLDLNDALTEEIFLEELHEQETFYSGLTNGFVGLVRFLRFHLTELGYTEAEARSMLNKLQRANKVEVYYVENPYDNTTKTAAIRCATP
ncbi:MAG: hypothetical protein KF777_04560 [Planctomycetaceae bacterium]|nr:hypothetical protein [Planctomycetaceae bacterium]